MEKEKMRRRLHPLLLAGLIGTTVSGSLFAGQYGGAVWGRSDIWWTPMELALPLPAAAKEFELYLGDELMQRQVERGALAVQNENGAMRPVAPAEIKIRLNNWQKIRAERLHGAVFAALSLGISLTCLVFGIARHLRERKENRSAS
ncbi:MAG: hypothetical protein ACTFAK_02675 [Candidatus Electronema sp. VV]